MSDSTHDASGETDDPAPSDGQESGGDSGSDKGKNGLEWAVTLAGAAVVLFVVGFLVYAWATTSDDPADLRVTLDAPRPKGSTVEIPVAVQNEGPRVAEAAVVEVCAGPDNCAQVTFDYVPFQSEVDGVVGLEAPLAQAPTSRVVSFRNP